jgi:hypothetical protein
MFALGRDHSLRIEDGQATRIRVLSGIVWLTEEGEPDDITLTRGSLYEVARPGVALLVACEPARVALQLPADTDPPRRVALKRGSAAHWRPVRWPFKSPLSVCLAATLRIVRRALSAWRADTRPRQVECMTTSEWYDHDVLRSRRRWHREPPDLERLREMPLETARDILIARYPCVF